MPSSTKEWADKRLSKTKPAGDPFAFLGGRQDLGEIFPIGALDSECLARAMSRWLRAGNAISFGLSGDRGALGVHLISGGVKRSRWFGTASEAEDFLTTIPEPG